MYKSGFKIMNKSGIMNIYKSGILSLVSRISLVFEDWKSSSGRVTYSPGPKYYCVYKVEQSPDS